MLREDRRPEGRRCLSRHRHQLCRPGHGSGRGAFTAEQRHATLVCELCADIYGSVSPDGKFMATVSPFFGGENVGDIGLLELATNKVTPLHIEGSGKEPTGIAFSPVLSSDMRQIAYLWASNKEKSRQLRVVPREPGGKPRVLANNPEIIYIEPHDWASNGSVLVMMQRPSHLGDRSGCRIHGRHDKDPVARLAHLQPESREQPVAGRPLHRVCSHDDQPEGRS